MDIKLSKTQQHIANEARRFLARECPRDDVGEMSENTVGYTDDFWRKMADMDWMAMRIPEAYGGMEMDLIDLSMVLEEMGRAVVPGPFFSTVMLAAEIIITAGNDAQKSRYLPGIADGKQKGTLALHEPDGGADPGYIQMETQVKSNEFQLNGTKLFVPDAHVADILICAARTRAGKDPTDGITLFLIDPRMNGLTISPLPTLDRTRKQYAVEFNQICLGPESVLGELHCGGPTLQRVLQRTQVGLCAESVGGAQRTMEIATDYAKQRVQYDQPIGAFQAIKHRCAQMCVEAESARSIFYWAAWAQDHGEEKEAAIAASAAKAYCTKAFTHNAESGIQVLGGTGFTMENDMHLFLKRAKANEMALGDPVYHRERVIQLLVSATT